ncbi:unnamed protein product, partial [Trichogramma brassicae]
MEEKRRLEGARPVDRTVERLQATDREPGQDSLRQGTMCDLLWQNFHVKIKISICLGNIRELDQ